MCTKKAIPTIEELLAKHSENANVALEAGRFEHSAIKASDAKAAFIEGIKLHVEAALTAGFLGAKLKVDWGDGDPEMQETYDTGNVRITVSKASILDAYPLSNIK